MASDPQTDGQTGQTKRRLYAQPFGKYKNISLNDIPHKRYNNPDNFKSGHNTNIFEEFYIRINVDELYNLIVSIC